MSHTPETPKRSRRLRWLFAALVTIAALTVLASILIPLVTYKLGGNTQKMAENPPSDMSSPVPSGSETPEELVPIPLELPKPMFKGTPTPIYRTAPSSPAPIFDPSGVATTQDAPEGFEEFSELSTLFGSAPRQIAPPSLRPPPPPAPPAPGSARLEAVPGTYETREVRVEVKPPSTRLETIPAKYETVTERVLVEESSTRLEVTPAKYETRAVQVEVAPGEYRTVTKRVMVQPPTTRSIGTPAKYSTLTRQKMVAPAQTREIPVPAEYRTVKQRVLVTPPSAVNVPAPVKQIDYKSPDEVWILARPGQNQAQPKNLPRAGLVVEIEEEDRMVELPLKHTQVRADIAGVLNTVRVLQQYENPFDEKIEVTYQFPLPTDAAVTDFLMTVGERTIRGIIREKEEAKKIYQAARARGHVASLMTQARPNIFEQKVANIEPGKQIDLDITYFNTLQLVDGYYEFTFPTTIGPRFNPSGTTDGIGAALQRGTSPQPTTITYLPPNERAGNDIDLEINLQAGMEIQALDSPTHEIQSDEIDNTHRIIRLSRLDRIPNKDFVLRYRLASDKLQSAFLRSGDHFVAFLEPPDDLKHLDKQHRELIFVVDCSGSMSGEPMAKAKAAMRKAIRQLEPDDTFAILKFSEHASSLSDKPLAATADNVAKGLAYIAQMRGMGGTHMRAGVEAALGFEGNLQRQRIITFMTDGYIGNEAEIVRTVSAKLDGARIFSFGLGSSVNRHLIEGLARAGRGAAAYITLNEDPGWVVDGFYNRIAHAALMNTEVDWNGLTVEGVYPSRLPDLLPGRPVIITGRCRGELPDSITLKGTVGGKEVAHKIAIDAKEAAVDHPGIASIWARQRLKAMAYHEIKTNSHDLKDEMTSFSIEHSVMSKYTAFVAVDSASKTDADEPARPVQQPNAMPEGVKHEKTVGQVQPAPIPRPQLPLQPALPVKFK